MKKSNALVLLYFVAMLLAASIVSCSTQKGYNYKSHYKHNSDGPSKCYKQHNKW